MTSWNEKLEQERLEAVRRSQEGRDRQNALRERLQAQLIKLGVRGHLEDIKGKVWEVGDIKSFAGHNHGGKWGAVECVALQLHFEYQDVGQVVQEVPGNSGGALLYQPSFAAYNRITYKNYDITVGVANVPAQGVWHDDIKPGDYLYVIYPLRMDGEKRKWTIGDNFGEGISLSKSDTEVAEYLERQLLSCVRLPLPTDVKREADVDIARFHNGTYR